MTLVNTGQEQSLLDLRKKKDRNIQLALFENKIILYTVCITLLYAAIYIHCIKTGEIVSSFLSKFSDGFGQGKVWMATIYCSPVRRADGRGHFEIDR